MKTNLPPTFYGLDHLRAFAIAYVFIFHYIILSHNQPAWLPLFAQFGWTGVDLFFVLSGFLIASQLFAEVKESRAISLKQFFVKRFFRILPAYLVTVALYFCLPSFREKESLPELWRFLTFTQNFGLNLAIKGTFSHAWSLCVEEHFYLVLPLVLILLQWLGALRKAYWFLLLLFIAGFVFRWNAYTTFTTVGAGDPALWYQYVYYPTYNRLDGLLVGISIAAFYRFLPQLHTRLKLYANACIALGVVVLGLAYWLCAEQQSLGATVLGFPLIAFGYGLVVLGAISEGSFLYRWPSKVTTFIATLSYGIYLTHKGLVHITRNLLSSYELPEGLVLLACLLSCIAGAYVLHQAVEKPFMQLRKRILNDAPATKGYEAATNLAEPN